MVTKFYKEIWSLKFIFASFFHILFEMFREWKEKFESSEANSSVVEQTLSRFIQPTEYLSNQAVSWSSFLSIRRAPFVGATDVLLT